MLLDLLLARRNRRRNARLLRLDTPRAVDAAAFVKLGGIDQWVTIRGEDHRNPVLLVVHGGPGSSYRMFTPMLRPWERHFTVVQWDQRGCGKTFERSGKVALGFAELESDGLELADHLCARLGQDKLILVASSVGSIVGLRMVKTRPARFHAYVGTDQNVGQDPDGIGLRFLVEGLRATGHSRLARQIERAGTRPGTQRDFMRRNRAIVGASNNVPNMVTDLILPAMLSSPHYRLRDVWYLFKGMSFSLDCLYQELIGFDARRLGLDFALPFFVFQGDTDLLTPTPLARQFFDEVHAPHKGFRLMEKAGHLALFVRPEAFLGALLDLVIPVIGVGSLRQRDEPPQQGRPHPATR